MRTTLVSPKPRVGLDCVPDTMRPMTPHETLYHPLQNSNHSEQLGGVLPEGDSSLAALELIGGVPTHAQYKQPLVLRWVPNETLFHTCSDADTTDVGKNGSGNGNPSPGWEGEGKGDGGRDHIAFSVPVPLRYTNS